MEDLVIRNSLPDTRCWGGLIEGMKQTFKGWVREAVEEAISDKMSNAMLEDRLLTADELCERWHINKNTLHTREKNGIIKPLNMDGKKKMYSLNDIKEVEISGMVKMTVGC